MTLFVFCLAGMLTSGCSRQGQNNQNRVSRIGSSVNQSITVPEITIASTNELGQPVDSWKPVLGKIPGELVIGEITKIKGSFSVDDGGVAPTGVIVYVSPPDKIGYGDAYLRETGHCQFLNFPEPNSTFEMDIKLPKDKTVPGPSWITIWAFGNSWETLKPIAHLNCQLVKTSSQSDGEKGELVAVLQLAGGR